MIKTVHLSKVYRGEVKALVDVNIDISKGEFVFLVGPSGSGKSTLTKIFTKDEEPSEGEVFVAGRPLNKLPKWRVPYLRRALGVVFQDFKLLENKTVYENVSFALEVIGYSEARVRPLVQQTLELVGLSDKHDRMPHELSGGEQQRVSIARAFVNRPQILIADEPTGNLDPATSLEIVRLLDRINRVGTTVLMATHDHAIVDAMRRRVIELEGGHVVRDQDRGVYGPRD
jgi:cell division transport system ATP-binding protein